MDGPHHRCIESDRSEGTGFQQWTGTVFETSPDTASAAQNAPEVVTEEQASSKAQIRTHA